ncbi:sensor histidine kinase [Chitinophaga parva]|uniref:histidine kinase n=1 Tax=Chitinophaga parva TaxID=2169414 RepID=A0A2T7BG21_9BACT|nr:sensor histidine kinase [Chitinophaga parva]PUZ25231.1 sensor histidine kinase [Chitinophaga parva]
MPVKFRITFFFTAIVFAILLIVCLSIYYIAYTNRKDIFDARLVNRARTTARLLDQSDIFGETLIQKIDAATSVSMMNKTIAAYDYQGKLIYEYTDKGATPFPVSKNILAAAQTRNEVYFNDGRKEAVAYHFQEGKTPLILVAAAYDEDGWDHMEQLHFILLLCFFGGILITIAAGYLFSTRLLRPIRKMADAVNDIKAQNLTQRIRTGDRKDEWNYLAETLNVLLNRLEESFATQGQFIASASHELSTPLTSIYSQLEVSLQKERGAEEYRRVMLSVREDVHKLNQLTHSLLQFAKASGTPAGLDIFPVRIDEILLRMPGEISKISTDYHVKVDFVALPTEEKKLLVLGNEGLLFSAIKNIVLNACKYSDNQTAILELSVTKDIQVKVRNSGKGIAPQALEQIFRPFYRAEENRAENGFGLGLPLAAQIIKLHRGKIKVDSVPDKETVFTLILPTATV